MKSSRASANLKAWCAKQQLNRQRRELTVWTDDGIGWFTGAEEQEGSSKTTDQRERETPDKLLQAEVNSKPSKKSVKIQTEPVRVIEDVEEDDLRWQPLSSGALAEHSGVCVRVAIKPLKSSLKRNAMWRPPPRVDETILAD